MHLSDFSSSLREIPPPPPIFKILAIYTTDNERPDAHLRYLPPFASLNRRSRQSRIVLLLLLQLHNAAEVLITIQ